MIVPCLGIYFTLWVKYIKILASSKNLENPKHASGTGKMESDHGSEQGLGEGHEGQPRDIDDQNRSEKRYDSIILGYAISFQKHHLQGLNRSNKNNRTRP